MKKEALSLVVKRDDGALDHSCRGVLFTPAVCPHCVDDKAMSKMSHANEALGLMGNWVLCLLLVVMRCAAEDLAFGQKEGTSVVLTDDIGLDEGANPHCTPLKVGAPQCCELLIRNREFAPGRPLRDMHNPADEELWDKLRCAEVDTARLTKARDAVWQEQKHRNCAVTKQAQQQKEGGQSSASVGADCVVTTQGENNWQLGNTMFRYASALGVARHFGCRFCPNPGLVRTLADDGLAVDPGECGSSTPRWNYCLQDMMYYAMPNGFFSGFADFPGWDWLEPYIYSTPSRTLCLHGFLQAQEFFKAFLPEVRRALQFGPMVAKECHSLAHAAAQAKPGRNLISVHVRGQDTHFETVVSGHPKDVAEARVQWFVSTVMRLHQEAHSCVAIVSDSHDWVRAHLLAPLQAVTGCASLLSGSSRAVDMCIASRGDSIIVSGGTFGLWAAGMASNPSAKVYYDPRRFRWDLFKKGTGGQGMTAAVQSFRNFYPTSWVALDSGGHVVRDPTSVAREVMEKLQTSP